MFTVAVSDCVFANLDATTRILGEIGARLVLADQPTRESIQEAACNADALIVTYAKIDGDLIRQLKKCRIIARLGIGVDNIDIQAATDAGIVVTNVPDYCIDEVADHTLALLLALVRKIVSSNNETHSGQWDMRRVIPIRRLRGSVLGLVGFGRIAQAVAVRALAFGMDVIIYDPHSQQPVCERYGVRSVALETLLSDADFVSIHCPLVPATERLFREQTLRQMKPTAYLVNTARGPIIDEQSLTEALDAGWIAGAGLDVLTKEPFDAASAIWKRNDIILTPHTSFYSLEAMLELETKAAKEVVRCLTGNAPRNPINAEALLNNPVH